ncbi:MAG: hypothetical protein AAF990_13970 [Bacteroidota bacterium]
MKMLGLRPLEIFLLQFILYMALWLWNDYLASLISLVFGAIFLFIFLLSLILEWIERSKVPRAYFILMLLSVLAPALAAICYLYLFQGVSWLE